MNNRIFYFPKQAVKSFLREKDYKVIHQFEPFDYIVSKGKNYLHHCKNCRYSQNSPLERVFSSSKSLNELVSFCNRFRYYDNWYTDDPLLVKLKDELKSFKSFPSYLSEIKLDPQYTLINNIYLNAIERYMQYAYPYIAKAHLLYALLSSLDVSSFSADNMSRYFLDIRLLRRISRYKSKDYFNTLIRIYNCPGGNHFERINDSCPAGYNFKNKNTIYSSGPLFMEANIYQNAYQELKASSVFLYEYVSDEDWFQPPRLSNVYDSGKICFGTIHINDTKEAFNAFWNTPFNSDLSSVSKDVYSNKTFFERVLKGAVELPTDVIGLCVGKNDSIELIKKEVKQNV